MSSYFFFNDPATTEIYTLSLHDALPIYRMGRSIAKLREEVLRIARGDFREAPLPAIDDEIRDLSGAVNRMAVIDRKSTRLNSSHVEISYAVFCLKKKKKKKRRRNISEYI